MKYSKWRMLLTAVSTAAVLAGCGSEAGEDVPVSVPVSVTSEPSKASGTGSEPTETPDMDGSVEQEDIDAPGTEAEAEVGEYTLWTGTYTLYVTENYVLTNILEEVGYDMSGNLILEGYYPLKSLSVASYLDYAAMREVLINEWTKWDYDEHGNVTKEFTLSSHDIMNENAVKWVTEYENEYDTQGNLIKKTSNSGEWIEYEYDALGNLISETSHYGDEVGSWMEYEYDASGNLTKETTGHGGVWADIAPSWTEYEYDASGNLTKETSGYGDDVRNRTEYEYDASGNLTRVGKSEIEYDTSGRLIKITSSDGATEYEYEYEYDAAGNLIKEKRFKNGWVITWVEYEYTTSDKHSPQINQELSLESEFIIGNYIKFQDNPIKITWYDSQDNIDRTWEWSYEIINE